MWLMESLQKIASNDWSGNGSGWAASTIRKVAFEDKSCSRAGPAPPRSRGVMSTPTHTAPVSRAIRQVTPPDPHATSRARCPGPSSSRRKNSSASAAVSQLDWPRSSS